MREHRPLTGLLRLARGAAGGLLLLVAACSGGDEPTVWAVSVDGGADGIALLGEHAVAAGPGEVVRIEHASPRPGGRAEAPTTHAFVAGDTLPPLFVSADAGLQPNAGVWGHCRGGQTGDALGTCPVPPIDAPDSWDGDTYWSTGAMLPGEHADIPLAEDVPDGTHQLVCALHPELVISVHVGGGVPDQPAPTTDLDAVESALDQVEAPPGEVFAGVEVSTPAAFAYRFVPARLTVSAGDRVTWTAGGRAPVDVVFGDENLSLAHTDPSDGLATPPTGGWDGTGEISSGYLSGDSTAGAAASAFSVQFTTPGVYAYASRFADDMTGEVVVTP